MKRDRTLIDARTDQRRYVSLRIAAAYLGVDEKTLRKYLDERLLEYVRFGARRKIEPSELAAFEDRQRVTRRVG